jgi:hypothetical protein
MRLWATTNEQAAHFISGAIDFWQGYIPCMTIPKTTVSLLAWALLTGCAASRTTGNDRAPLPPATESQRQILGVDASVQLAAAFAQARGYDELQLEEVSHPSAGLVRIRFGLTPKNGGKVLTLQIDRSLGKVVRAEEQTDESIKLIDVP